MQGYKMQGWLLRNTATEEFKEKNLMEFESNFHKSYRHWGITNAYNMMERHNMMEFLGTLVDLTKSRTFVPQYTKL